MGVQVETKSSPPNLDSSSEASASNMDRASFCPEFLEDHVSSLGRHEMNVKT